MSAITAELKKMRLLRKKLKTGSGLVYVLNDLERVFSEGLLDEVTTLYEKGYEPEEIGSAIGRDPDEVFIALFHQARKGEITRPFAYRRV